MFSKGFIVFGLLALFACQGATALTTYEIERLSISEVEKLSLGELIDKVKEVIGGLEQLVGGVISDALGTLGSLVNTLKELKDKYLQGGIDAIQNSIGTVVDFIKNATEKAAEIGVDISECVAGQDIGLDKLTEKLVGELTTCITNTANDVLTTVNNDIKIVKDIVANVTAIPVKLSKCLISLRPVGCVTDLLKDTTALLTTIPTEVLRIVGEATALVNKLPTDLLGCVNGIAGTAVTETTNIIADIAVCVEDKIVGSGTTPPPTFVSRASIGDIVNQIKEVIESLNKLVSGVIGDALGTLGNLVSTITEIKDKFLGEGIAAITGGIGNVIDFIKNKTQEAAELGIDITKCITGRDEQLKQLASGLTANLTDCVTTTVGNVLTMVKDDIKIINQIVGNVTAIPLKLSKCLISLRPITCLTNLLGDVTTMLKNLPGQIIAIVDNAKNLVAALPDQLLGCVANIVSSTTSQTEAIITDIGTCVDGVISGSTTSAATAAPTDAPTAAPTDAPTAAPTDAPTSAPIAASRASLGEIVDQIKEAIATLNQLVSGVIGDALGTLGNLVSTITALKDKFLGEGIDAITGGIGDVIDFIKNKTQEAAELGIDITKCIAGRDEQLKQLASGLTANLTDCVTTTVGSVLTMVNNDIKIINQIVSNVTAIPLKLSKCLISLRPITCVTNLLGDVTTLIKNLPGQIIAIVKEATSLVDALPGQLLGCVDNIVSSTTSQTQAIITDIGTCVDGVISGSTTTAATST